MEKTTKEQQIHAARLSYIKKIVNPDLSNYDMNDIRDDYVEELENITED